MNFVPSRPSCPKCRGRMVGPIIYGMPDEQVEPFFRSGQIRPGGAMGRLADHSGSHWHCETCEAEWRGGMFAGGTGDSVDDPVLICGITDDAVGIRAEYQYLTERFGLQRFGSAPDSPGWRVIRQALLSRADHLIDMLTIDLAPDEAVSVYFDISAFQRLDPKAGADLER